jgi:hypothetical protein
VTDYAQSTLAGKKDDLLIYRKRLRHRLDAYLVNVPPQVRAARIADELQRPRRPARSNTRTGAGFNTS